jgi:hypothetical protein
MSSVLFCVASERVMTLHSLRLSEMQFNTNYEQLDSKSTLYHPMVCSGSRTSSYMTQKSFGITFQLYVFARVLLYTYVLCLVKAEYQNVMNQVPCCPDSEGLATTYINHSSSLFFLHTLVTPKQYFTQYEALPRDGCCSPKH